MPALTQSLSARLLRILLAGVAILFWAVVLPCAFLFAGIAHEVRLIKREGIF